MHVSCALDSNAHRLIHCGIWFASEQISLSMDPLVAQRTNSSSRSPGSSASPASRQQGDGDVRMEGLVIIVLGEGELRPEVIDCLRPKLRVKSSDYTWLDENDNVILNHVFRDSLANHHPWRDDTTQTPWTVDFHTGEMNVSEVRCRNDHQQTHHKSMSYEFSNSNDYALFHTKIRGKQFIREYEIESVAWMHRNTHKEKRQWIKSLKSSSETSVAIPITLKGPGPASHWKIKHVEITASWMKWDRVGNKEVKAEVKKADKKRSSSSEEPAPLRRSSSSWLMSIRSKRSSPPAATSLEQFTVPSSFGQEWHKVTIGFSETKGKIVFPPFFSHCRTLLTLHSERRFPTRCDSKSNRNAVFSILSHTNHSMLVITTSIDINGSSRANSVSVGNATHQSAIVQRNDPF